MIYKLDKTDTDNEKSLKESLLTISRPIEKSLEELVAPVTTSNLTERIRKL